MKRFWALTTGLIAIGLLSSPVAPGASEQSTRGGSWQAVVLDYDLPPMPMRTTMPQYPLVALQQGIEGTVVLELVIDAEGCIGRARVIESVPELDEAALRSVKRWRFSPAMRDGRPVTAIVHAPIVFRCPGSDKDVNQREAADDPRTTLFGIRYLR